MAGTREIVRSALAWVGVPWRARAATTYFWIISATSLVQAGTSARLGNAILRASSTNLQGLARNPLNVLVVSALWLDRGGYLFFVATFVLVLAPLEHWLGWWRAVLAFAAGHIGASLLVALGLSIGVRTHQLDRSIARVIDVGASYGTAACAALLCYRAPRRGRIVAVAVVWAVLIVALVRDANPTAWGHVIAAAIGFAGYPLTLRARRPRRARVESSVDVVSGGRPSQAGHTTGKSG